MGYGTVVKDVTMAGDTQPDLQLVREPTYALSGVVFEVTASGLAAVENVSVYCDGCGEDGHTWSFTDADGRYHFPEVYAGITPLLVRTTRFDIQLVRR